MLKKFFIFFLVLYIMFAASAETITFGAYWQRNRTEKIPLEWIVLDETDDAYLLITKYSIDASIFAHNHDYTTWANSLVRKILNKEFYDNAFSEDEKAQIVLTKVMADLNPQYKQINQGKNAYDYVFLLSILEAEKYFKSNNERIATATEYAKMGADPIKWVGAYTSPFGATCWRLRTMGINNYSSCSVRANGSISYEGDILYSPHYAIRPCIWIRK